MKRFREEAGITQAELAERAGMNRFGVAKLEQGHRDPTWQTVQVLCRALGLSCAVFEGVVESTPESKPPAKPRGRPRKQPPTPPGEDQGEGQGRRGRKR